MCSFFRSCTPIRNEFLWPWPLHWLLQCQPLLIYFSTPEPKAHWWAYRIGRPVSSVAHPSVRRPHIFSSETAGPIKVKFHMAPPWDVGTGICSNGPGHMTKVTVMPIYGKNLKESSPKPKGQWPWNLICSIGCSSTTKFVQMMTLGWPILWQGQIWSLMLLYG